MNRKSIGKIHYCWVICFACTLCMFFTCGLLMTTFSVFLPYMMDYADLTNTQSSTVVTIRNLFCMIGMLCIDKVYKRIQLRTGILCAMLGAAFAFFLFSLCRSFFAYCAVAVLGGIMFSWGSMVPVTLMIARWFHSHRGLALAICASSTGVASLVGAPLITILIESTSLPTAFRTIAMIMVISALIVFSLLRNNPAEMGLSPLSTDSKMKKNQSAAYRPHMPDRSHSAGKTIIFAMALSHLLIGASMDSGMIHLSLLFSTEGFHSMDVASLISINGATMIIAKCIFGAASDHWGTKRTSFVFFCLCIIGTLLCSFAGTGNMLIAVLSVIFFGSGTALTSVGPSVFAHDMSSEEDFGRVLKYFQIGQRFGAFVIAVVPGMIADWTGSYVYAYLIFMCFAAISMIIVQTSYKHRLSGRHSACT